MNFIVLRTFCWLRYIVFNNYHCLLTSYAFAAANGISFIQFTNNNSMRNMYVLGLSLFLGISIPYYFMSYTMAANHGPVNTGGGWVSYLHQVMYSHTIFFLCFFLSMQCDCLKMDSKISSYGMIYNSTWMEADQVIQSWKAQNFDRIRWSFLVALIISPLCKWKMYFVYTSPP